MAKSTKNQDKIGTLDTFRAPWETESGAEVDVDKPVLKRLLFNLKLGEAKALDAVDDAKVTLTEVETERDTFKEQAADANGTEAQKTIDKLQKKVDDLTAERDKLVTDKEKADLRSEVLGDLDPKYAKYVQGDTKEELEQSLEDVKKDFGLDAEPGEDDEEEDEEEPVVRTTPRTRALGNPADPKNGLPAEKPFDYDKAANDMLAGGLIFT